MVCFGCGREVPIARKVKLRVWRDYEPEQGGPDSAAYQTDVEEMTFRWAVVCLECYRVLDNDFGIAPICDRKIDLAGASRGDKAAVIDEAKYQAWQRREREKLGLD